VVELAVGPLGDRMARRASRCCRGETGRNVIWHTSAEGRRAVPCRQVAAHAVRGVQRVVIVDVTGRAGRRRGRSVCAGQSETSHAVVKRRRVPALGGMAGRAIRRGKCRPGSRVHGVRRLLPFRKMASRTSAVRWRNRQIVVVVDVAGSAGHIRVAVRQQESCGRMVEIGRVPALGGMAGRAIRDGKDGPRRRVYGIVGLLPGRQVALRIPAVRRRDLQIVVVVDVAGCASHVGMAVRQRKSRGIVIKFRTHPTVKRMAGFASRRELRAHVIGIRSLLEIRQVAGGTGRGKTLELADGGALVAVLALHGSMSAEEWETILVIVDLLYGDLPALHGVALRAVRPHLPLVDIGVTILAILAHVGEHRFGVALRAGHLFMQTAQRILGLIVVEFGDRTDGAPSCGGMAILAGNR
jgi:hypothetical protein